MLTPADSALNFSGLQINKQAIAGCIHFLRHPIFYKEAFFISISIEFYRSKYVQISIEYRKLDSTAHASHSFIAFIINFEGFAGKRNTSNFTIVNIINYSISIFCSIKVKVESIHTITTSLASSSLKLLRKRVELYARKGVLAIGYNQT